jgi:hypothetical protein
MSDLQFDKAEYATGDAAAMCAACQTPLTAEYFAINGQSLCPACTSEARRTLESDPGSVGFLRAVAGGIGGGAAGALLYWGVSALSGYQFALIAIVVGWLVGKGIQWGTGGRGSVLYQILAVLLTYLSIAVSYVPDILQSPEATGPAYVIFVVVMTLIAPIVVSFNSIFGAIIIAIGLWEAWKIPRAIVLDVAGPFQAPAMAAALPPIPAPPGPGVPPPPTPPIA